MSKPEYVESWLNNAGNKRGWSGSQVRLTRLELTLYRTDRCKETSKADMAYRIFSSILR